MARLTAFWLSLCLGLIVGGCGTSHSGREAPQAIGGILDLSRWDFDRDGPLKLDGEWKFLWDQFLTPEELTHRAEGEASSILRVPGAWTTTRERPDAAQGHGTAWLKIRGLRPLQQAYALHISQIGTAYQATLFRPEAAKTAEWSWRSGKPSLCQGIPRALNSMPSTTGCPLVVLNISHRTESVDQMAPNANPSVAMRSSSYG